LLGAVADMIDERYPSPSGEVHAPGPDPNCWPGNPSDL